MLINSIYADNIIKTALLEDINYLDTTTDYLIDEEQGAISIPQSTPSLFARNLAVSSCSSSMR